MESRFVGDDYVKHQCLRAMQHEYYCTDGLPRRYLPKMWNSVLQYSKDVRRRRRVSNGLLSWVSDKVGCDRKMTRKKNILIVGAGAMGQACASHLHRCGHNIIVFNRSSKNVLGRETLDLESLDAMASDANTIVHCADVPLKALCPTHLATQVIDMTEPSMTSGMSNVVRIPARAYCRRREPDSAETRNYLHSAAQSILKDMVLRDTLAAACRPFNSELDKCQPSERELLLRKRHAVVSKIRDTHTY